MTERSQAFLRMMLQRATLPAVTVKDLAGASGVSAVTIGKFIRGSGLAEDQEVAVRKALLTLLPSENA